MCSCSCKGFPAWSPLSAGEFRGVTQDMAALAAQGVDVSAAEAAVAAAQSAVSDLGASVGSVSALVPPATA